MGGVGVSFAGALEEDFDVGFFHFLADFVVDDLVFGEPVVAWDAGVVSSDASALRRRHR